MPNVKHSSAFSSHLALLVTMGVALGLRVASPATATLGYLVLAIYALFGRAQVLHALGLSWFLTMLNPAIAASGSSVGRYVVLGAAAGSVAFRSKSFWLKWQLSSTVGWTFLLGAGLFAHAAAFSHPFDISGLKVTAWLLATATILSAWHGLQPNERAAVSSRLFGGLMLLMFLSLALIPTSIGYFRNGVGFQGLLNHPQAFGLTMALLGTVTTTRLLTDRTPSWSAVLSSVLCFALILLSQARTAGLSLLASLVIAVIAVPIVSRQPVRELMPGLQSRRVYGVVGLSLPTGLVAGPLLFERIGVFMAKRHESDSLLEAYDSSRGDIIRAMWGNIVEDPFWGIGFGLPSDPRELQVALDPVSGLPVGAAVEKGVMPLAVWEELGIIGLCAVGLWLWGLVRRSARAGVTPLALCTAILLINLGESILFSPGGMGLLCLLLLGWASTATTASASKSAATKRPIGERPKQRFVRPCRARRLSLGLPSNEG